MPPYGLPMTHSARVLTAHAVLDQLMASIGVDGLVAALRNPALLAAVDQQAAAIRETLRGAGRDVDVVALAGYARSVLAVLNRHGQTLPEATEIDWIRAPGHIVRLVAICALAESGGML
jgi:Family of unknown function (DUF6401)